MKLYQIKFNLINLKFIEDDLTSPLIFKKIIYTFNLWVSKIRLLIK